MSDETRQELLTKLAIELRDWPGGDPRSEWPYPLINGWGESCGMLVSNDLPVNPITREDWLAERERLINKPSWDDSPEWAEWLAQDKDGQWVFYENKPPIGSDEWHIFNGEFSARSPSNQQPAGHDWRQTLERRPSGDSSSATACDSQPQGLKFDTEKPRMDLMLTDMPLALEAIGRVLTSGAIKYAPGNWQHVDDAQRRYQSAGIRHDLALSRGETNDPETGEHHLAHAACCILFRLELALREDSDGPT